MCGIAGILDFSRPPDLEALGAMTGCLRHRGPDAEGIQSLGPLALGHRRLSIIDTTEAANQPMVDCEHRCWIVFNGEIYNFQELRSTLAAYGARFRTKSDTEVILEAYKAWGPQCVERFNGMFAFAIWDEPHQELFLARDRLGKKPLYYQRLPDGLVFASELKALRIHPDVCADIDPPALGQFLSLNYLPTSICFISGVRKLPAAHHLLIRRGREPEMVRYWDLAAHFNNKRRFASEGHAAEELRGLIDDAVRLRLISDVPLGAFLSSGLDSGAIVAAMCAIRPAAQNHTFSIGFKEESFTEVVGARATAGFLGVDHADRTVDIDMAGELPAIVRAADEPFADTSIIPMYYLAAFARERVTVCLSGDGGDENFAGYETYVADRINQATRWVPRPALDGLHALAHWALPSSQARVSLDYKIRHFLSGHSADVDRAHCSWRLINTLAEGSDLIRADRRAAVARADPFLDTEPFFADVVGCHHLDRAMYVDIKTWLVDDILTKVDRATMAHSLEARAPLLDHRVVEFAASLPVSWKLKYLRKKHLLKRSQSKRLPRPVVERRKQGFNAPVSQWLQGRMGELARCATLEGPMLDWFDRGAVDRLWKEHGAGAADHGLKLFGLTCLGLWMKQ